MVGSLAPLWKTALIEMKDGAPPHAMAEALWLMNPPRIVNAR
jgi:hypothetical protein